MSGRVYRTNLVHRVSSTFQFQFNVFAGILAHDYESINRGAADSKNFVSSSQEDLNISP